MFYRSEREVHPGAFRLIVLLLSVACVANAFQNEKVGSKRGRSTFVATGQWVTPAGKTLAFAGRPIDLVLAPDGRTLYVKQIGSILIVDVTNWKVRQELKYDKTAGSMHGIAVVPDGKKVFVTDSDSSLLEILVEENGTCAWGRNIILPAFDHAESYPCGVAISKDGNRAYVALSRNNSLAIVDLQTGKLEAEIPTGVAPFDVVLSPDETIAYVSNWGGRKPKSGERVIGSSGTDVLVDERSIPTAGTISKIDLRLRAVVSEVGVGLHPSDLELRHDGSRLYCANANSDNVSILSTEPFRVLETVAVRPDSSLLFGSITNALALSPDELTLYAANGGNNSIAVVALASGDNGPTSVKGQIPTGWFPSAVVTNGKHIFVASAKGEGSRQVTGKTNKWHVKWNRGMVSIVDIPSETGLASYTKSVLMPVTSTKSFRPANGASPLPVPGRVGEPSVFEHVVYVLKENRTYDQMFGDMKRGNNDSSLCMFGRKITPNHHAIADEFVLLDNYYCNGIVSADGHQWATQGVATDYQEKTFGSWTRTYDFGSDPLTFAPTEFIWENALLHGLTFRNYGEFDFPAIDPDSATWSNVYEDYKSAGGKIAFHQSIPLEPLRKFTCPTYPGWELRIPDALRIDAFMKEFAGYEQRGDWPNLVFVYLPQDHTSGKKFNTPTPRAHLADNDLSLGRLIEAISKSTFWPKTCIFVNEDDPQDGFDHVDGHRSICLVISPYTKRGKVVSRFYNQTSVLHTIERILGLEPMNRFDAMAPTMEECFTDKPDLTPYKALPNIIPFDEMNPRASLLNEKEFRQQKISESFDLSRPDRIDDDQLNRILWHDAMGYDKPYPAHLAGGHGRGLKALHLKLKPHSGGDGH